ncbi:MAG: spermidine synthase, partial [Ruminococcus sp.]|nr:spermidine synthase [Ruminococcus sp.]
MDLWFTENHTDNVRFSFKIKKQLFSEKSYYQQIDVFDTFEFGRVLVLDGFLMLTEKDEYIYHEMVTHVPMAVNPDIKNVLIIGAGDGGTLREICRYEHIEKIDMVEIDEKVVEVCKEFLPQTACKFDDQRLQLHIADGLKFVRQKNNEYD